VGFAKVDQRLSSITTFKFRLFNLAVEEKLIAESPTNQPILRNHREQPHEGAPRHSHRRIKPSISISDSPWISPRRLAAPTKRGVVLGSSTRLFHGMRSTKRANSTGRREDERWHPFVPFVEEREDGTRCDKNSKRSRAAHRPLHPELKNTRIPAIR